MRGCDVGAKLRRVSREVGVPITVGTVDNACVLEAHDLVTGKYYVHPVDRKGDWDKALMELHERIYRDHGIYVFEKQGGLCAECGKPMTRWEIDHRVPRSKGRDDRVQNLAAVDPPCHREKHGARPHKENS